MKGPRDRRPRREGPINHITEGRPAGRGVLRELAGDPAYLEVKERLGEVLTPSERFALELARAERDVKREGGDPP